MLPLRRASAAAHDSRFLANHVMPPPNAAATPPGSMWSDARGSAGIAALNPRLMAATALGSKHDSVTRFFREPSASAPQA